MKDADLIKCAQILKVLGNSKRLEIVLYLKDKEMNVHELEKKVKLSQSALSQHLAILRNAKIASTRREAQKIFYSLNEGYAVKIISLIDNICK